MANTLSSNLQTLLDNRLRYLPPLVGEAINSIDWSSKIIEIGHSFGMHVDEMEDFQAVVLKSMIGLIAPADFEHELIGALALSPANSEKIIQQINAQIFEPIHDYVVRGGKQADPLQQAGIHIEPELTVMPQVSQSMVQNTKPVADIDFNGEFSAPTSTTTAPEEDLFTKYFGSDSK